ncbi:MAG: type II secretion system protein GspD [Deltaproteobacteria bacterium]|nr:type II secretion system protein GspD [Deltaproteobacteria bacterium]
MKGFTNSWVWFMWLFLCLVAYSAQTQEVPEPQAFDNSTDEIRFVDSFIREDEAGKKLVLQFSPRVPVYAVVRFKTQNVSEVQWKSKAAQSVTKTYFVDGDTDRLVKAVVGVQAAEGKGILQIWHGTSSSYELGEEKGNELVLRLAGPPALSKVAKVASPVPIPIKQDSRSITLNVKRAPLDKVLRTLASEGQKSLVFGEEVTGFVSVNVRNLNYEDAVDTILRPTKYRAEHTPDATIVRVANDGKSFRVFHIKNVDVNVIKPTITDIAKNGQVTIDPNTNSIFVFDVVDVLSNVERMIATLDQTPQQVEVEAAILDIEDQDSKDIGFDLRGVDIHNGDVSVDFNSQKVSPLDSATSKGFYVGLTWKSVRGILGFLATNSKVHTLARPKVVTLSDKEATIIIGSKIGYKTLLSTNQGTMEQVNFLTVGTQLRITPHITKSGDILMHIKPEISDGQLDAKTNVPVENTTAAENHVLAKDGQTIVIGGLLRQKKEKREDKIPILGDIPLLGLFFKGSTEQTIKSELMILLSPKIVNQQVLNANEAHGSRMLDSINPERVQLKQPPSKNRIAE